MAGANLLALIDDIATLLDDISVMAKVAAKKTAGVLGDDLALNAEQVTGVRAERELPVVWAVFKGSLKNKLILVPAALLISAFLPWAITPLLMIGGAFLCFEGFEKVAHKFLHDKSADDAKRQARIEAVRRTDADMLAFERERIKGAIRTDFILSAEIITITLGTVATAPMTSQIMVVCLIALGMTIGVYGLVAGIVKLDDAGLHLSSKQGESLYRRLTRAFGFGLLRAAPWLMKTLSVVGTAAMFLVGGGIIVHGITALHHWSEHSTTWAAAVPGVGAVLGALTPTLINALVGIITGGVVVATVWVLGRIRKSLRNTPAQ